MSSALLTSKNPAKLADFAALRECFEEVHLERTLAGEPEAARVYVRAWRSAREELLGLCQPLAHTVPTLESVLDQEAMSAPWTPWVVRLGTGKTGLAMALLARLRSLIGSPDAAPLDPPMRIASWVRLGVQAGEPQARFLRNVAIELERGLPLGARIRADFALTGSEFAALFGVSRQAVAQWGDDLPSAHLAKALVVGEIAALLTRRLRPGLLPAVARRPADAYGGATMLELVAADRHVWLLAELQRTFDAATTA